MHHIRMGNGSALLLLHGFCSSAETWGGTAAYLARDFDVIVPSWPGFGMSVTEGPCTTIDAFVQHLLSLVKDLEIDRFSVLAHSFGSFVLQELMINHASRLSAAVLYGAGLKIDSASRFETAEQTTAFLEAAGVEATVRKVAATWFIRGERDPAYPATVAAGLSMTKPAGIAMIRAAKDVDFSTRLPASTTPALVINGEKERTFPPSMALALATSLPKGSLCILPGCAHAAHLEDPAIFNAIVKNGLLRMLKQNCT